MWSNSRTTFGDLPPQYRQVKSSLLKTSNLTLLLRDFRFDILFPLNRHPHDGTLLAGVLIRVKGPGKYAPVLVEDRILDRLVDVHRVHPSPLFPSNNELDRGSGVLP